MATVNIYLNFPNNTEAAFNYYKEVFGGEFDGGVVEQTLQVMFWGAYFGSCADRFGIRRMVNCASHGSH